MADFIPPAHNTASPFADMRGYHVAVRTPDLETAKRWYVDKLDFRVVAEWDYADEQLAYLAPATDDRFYVEILGGGDPSPAEVRPYTDLGDSLKYAGYHHFCLNVASVDATVEELRARGVTIVTEEQFDGLFAVHLKGPFFLTQALLQLIADGGHIINLTSATMRVAFAGVAPYASFKGGLEVLTRYMAKEFADRKIRANSISPGAIRTELGGGLNDEFEAMLAGMIALGRVGDPEEIGGVIASLLSDDNRYINAQDIEVAGGYNI